MLRGIHRSLSIIGRPNLTNGACDPDRAIAELRRSAEAEQSAGLSGEACLVAWARVLSDAGRAAEASAVWARIPDDGSFATLVEKASSR